MSDHLSQALIIEIFTRLPPKTLLRFKSLSKSTCAIISSRDFIRMHTLRSPKKFMIRHRKNKKDFITLHSEGQLPLSPRQYFGIRPLKFPYRRYAKIVGPCNGIICVEEHSISLWNPSIRRKLILPFCPISTEYIGFGYDPITDDYKIVSVSNSSYGVTRTKSSFVYALKTGVWCEIASPTPFYSIYESKACFVDATLHWVVKSDSVTSYVMTFDLSNHVFDMIALPEAIREHESIHLTIIQGSLAAVFVKFIGTRSWVRKDASWSVYLESKRSYFDKHILNVLQGSSNGDLLFHTRNKWIHVYDRMSGSIKSRLLDFSGAISYKMVGVEMCIESLDIGMEIDCLFFKEKRVEFSG